MKKQCPNCRSSAFPSGTPTTKCIVLGLPMWLCPQCGTGGGAGSYVFKYSNGRLMMYEGGYWRALWHWLFGKGR